jgi:hypothetical protein
VEIGIAAQRPARDDLASHAVEFVRTAERLGSSKLG